jgi:beta-phosphoglucomutase-like phosphatase (HAD superfamily)
MTSIAPIVTLSPRDYDAVLFDLDGVLTQTASVHAAAWKKLFDGFLERRAADQGQAFVPFDIDADYRRYVDGKPRYDGVAAFLHSRRIQLPWGTREDGPGAPVDSGASSASITAGNHRLCALPAPMLS